ncbi:hypothetical protein [Undibacterium sp. Di24W]|uniref:hypothetical protein n=1 Tax=Undibacterium sp. Di24W TaxID=3413033 RepID=UPI003BF3370E
MRKFLIGFGILIAGYFLYNADAYYGQWQFKEMCKKEGGPRFYGKIEKNAGWLLTDTSTSAPDVPSDFGDISFFRWTDKEGKEFDIYVDWELRKKMHPRPSEYTFLPADKSKVVRYEYRYKTERMLHDERFVQSQEEIIDIATQKKQLASYTIFSYQWTKPERVILSAPTSVTCWQGETNETQITRNNFYKNIYTAWSK